MGNSSLPSRKLYEQVVEVIAKEIQDGVFKAGTKLPPERELADRFQVSRPTVREAMLALELQGIVEARRGSGVFVLQKGAHSPGVQDSLDIGPFELTEARALFEGEAAALAAKLITDEELIELSDLLVEMIEENEDEKPHETADKKFHMVIAKATRNAAIAQVIENLWDIRYQSRLCRHMLEKARDKGLKPQIDEHRKILDALTRREPQLARMAMRDHLGRVIEGLLEATETETLEQVRLEMEKKRHRYVLP